MFGREESKTYISKMKQIKQTKVERVEIKSKSGKLIERTWFNDREYTDREFTDKEKKEYFDAINSPLKS